MEGLQYKPYASTDGTIRRKQLYESLCEFKKRFGRGTKRNENYGVQGQRHPLAFCASRCLWCKQGLGAR